MNQEFMIVMIVIIGLIAIISIILNLINTSKINDIMEFSEDGDLVESLEKYYSSIRDMQKKFKGSQTGVISDRVSACESKINLTLSKIGIVNFDAFDDVRGNQSFALAVLNRYNDGFVITSLYGNNSSNTYVRNIKEGKSQIKLLAEEEEAVNRAVSSNNIN